jgi:hypothetical protein
MPVTGPHACLLKVPWLISLIPVLRGLTSVGLQFKVSLDEKLHKIPISKQKSWAWWHTPVIPAKARSIK